MGNFDFKDKKNIYAIVITVLILAMGYYVWDYMWNPFVEQRTSLENELRSAQSELDKINAKKHRIAELELQLVQAEKDFEKRKEMFPVEVLQAQGHLFLFGGHFL